MELDCQNISYLSLSLWRFFGRTTSLVGIVVFMWSTFVLWKCIRLKGIYRLTEKTTEKKGENNTFYLFVGSSKSKKSWHHSFQPGTCWQRLSKRFMILCSVEIMSRRSYPLTFWSCFIFCCTIWMLKTKFNLIRFFFF